MKGAFLFLSLVILASLMIAMTSFAYSPSPRKTETQTQTMTPGVHNMIVVPNQSRINARVLKIDQSPQFKDKWYLEIEILMIQPIKGGAFAEVGQTVQAFTIADQLCFKQNDVIFADAEYLGDQSGGSFQLTQVKVKP